MDFSTAVLPRSFYRAHSLLIFLLGFLLLAGQAAHAVNEVQTITLSSVGGTVTVGDGQGTASFAKDATATQVQTALQALPSIGTGNLSVSGAVAPSGGTNQVGTGTSSASSSSSSYPVSNAFDNSTSSYWLASSSSTPQWITYDFGAGNAKTITEYAITGPNYYPDYYSAPADWNFQGSNDNTTWTTLDTRTGQNPSSRTLYSTTNSSAYRYYRVLITAQTSSYTSQVGIAELELIGGGTLSSGQFTLEFVGARADANIAQLTSSTTGVTMATTQQGAPAPMPAVPTSLSATPQDGQVALRWSASANALSYKVKWATTSGGPYTSIPVSGTSYTHSGRTNNTAYFYVVSAVNLTGESANSAQVSATPRTAPAAPGGVSATPRDGQVVLNWSAVTGATAYSVRRAIVTGGPYTTIEQVSSPGYTDTGLINGTRYYYIIVALNQGVEGLASVEVNAQPLASPVAASGLTAIAGDGRVYLSWTAGARATGYEVWRSISGGAWSKIAPNLSTLTYTDSGLTNGLVHDYYVIAINAGGAALPSNHVAVIPAVLDTYAPGAPTFGAITSTSIELIAPALPPRATTLTLQRHLSAYSSSSSMGFVTVATGLAAGASTIVTGLTPKSSYTFRYVAVGSGGSTPGNEASTSTTAPAPTVPAAPGFDAVTNVDLTLLVPTLPVDATSFTVQRKLSTDPDTSYALNQQTGVYGGSPLYGSAITTGLNANTTYLYRLIAVGSGGSTTGPAASVTTAPAAPGTPQFSNVTATSATVTAGSPAPTLPAGASSLSLQIQIGSVWFEVGSGLTGTASVTVSNLSPSTSATFRYVAVGANGRTPGSTNSVSTSSGSASSTLPAPRFGEVTTTSLNVYAPVPLSYYGGSWTVQHKLAGAADTTYVNDGSVNYSNTLVAVSGLTAGTAYTFRFSSGSSSATPANVTTAPPAPGVPTFGTRTASSLIVIAPALPASATSLSLQRLMSGSSSGSVYQIIATGLTGGASTLVSGLSPKTAYSFLYIAVGSNGSTQGNTATQSTLPLAPAAPEAPIFSAVGATSVTVAALPLPADATSLTLQQKLTSASDTTYVDVVTGQNGTSDVTASGLTSQTSYTFRWKAVGDGGSTLGPPSAVTTTIPAPAAPGAPDLQFAANNSVRATLPDLPARATSLSLQKQSYSSGSPWITVATNQNAYAVLTVSGLTPGQTTYFRCVAVGAGGETVGTVASISIPGGPPDAPGAPRFGNLQEDSVTVLSPALPAGASYMRLEGKWQSQPDTAYFEIATNLGGNVYTDVNGLDSGQSYDFRYVAISQGYAVPGVVGTITMPIPVIAWAAGEAISCAGIRYPGTGNTIQAGTKGRLSAFLATDWDQRLIQINGQSKVTDISDPCSYTWACSGGSFENGLYSVQNPVWIAPTTPGTYTLTLVVDDQNGGNQAATDNGARNDAARGYNDEPLRFSVTITVVP